MKRIRLVAPSGEGIVPAAVRPPGFQVWNSDPLATDYDLDFGNPAETLRPIQLVGARNGTYSGKVVVGCDKPIRGLAATAGELKGTEGIIPASAIRIRWGMPWGENAGNLTNPDCGEFLPYPAEPSPLVALYDAAPKEIPVYKKPVTARCLAVPGQPEPVFGAVAPVWVTVDVPKDATPGTYAGSVTLTAEGLPPTPVAVQVKVLDFDMPDPTQRRTWVELIQSPDTLVLEYGVPMWSPKHWEMIAQSMTYLQQVGSRVLFVPLIAKSNAGNEESMVRWIKKPLDQPGAEGDSQYEYDFSIMDKYLDLAQKQLGKPQVVIFNVWDRYLIRKGAGGRGFQVESGLRTSRPGPLVTLVDPATGKTQEVCLPDYTEAAGKELWKPLFEQLRERMRNRGLEGAMNLGMISDFWPTKEQTEVLKEISGDMPWANAGHYTRKSLYEGLGKIGYQSSYFGTSFGYSKSLSGWKAPQLTALFERVGLDNYPISKWRLLPEQSITGNVRGVGRTGADAWPVVKDKAGRRLGRVWERYPGADWGYLNANCSVLAPGPDGAVSTLRFEALREGQQECEAIIVLEQALGDKALAERLGPELAKRCQSVLDERRQVMWKSLGLWQSGAIYSHEVTSWRERTGPTGYTWFLGSLWQDRSERLYSLAGEVARKLPAK